LEKCDNSVIFRLSGWHKNTRKLPASVAMNILVVEDEPELAAVLVRGLEEEQFRVQLCGEGQVALRRSEETSFDLILLDVMMPDLSGFEVVERMRLRSRETPVLMLTARDSLADIVRGLDLGADDYLTKPFSFVELLSRIRAIAALALDSKTHRLYVPSMNAGHFTILVLDREMK